MDHSRYGGFPSDTDATLFQILSEAQQRWLRPVEICEILRNYQKFKLTPEPPHKPQSGSLFLFDRKALRYFRRDGHNWRKKKDGKTVREAHERLKAGSVEVLHCYYAHGEDNDNFQRRSYWMLDKNEHIVLVHYREVKEGSRTGLRSPNSYPAEGSPSVGSSNVITGASPQTSPLVSPRASSTSADWNGQSYSPENDELDSNVDMVKYYGNEFESKPSNSPNGVAVVMEGLGLQSPMSFSMNIYDQISSQPHTIDNGSNSVFIEGGIVPTDRKTEVDLLEWCAGLKQNMSENGIHGNFLSPSHERIDVADMESFQQVRSLQTATGDLFSMTETHMSGPLEVANTPGYDVSPWDAPTTVLRNNPQTGSQEVFGANIVNESHQSQPQFSHADVMAHPGRVDKLVTDNKESSLMNSYSGVFKDFQADMLASQDNLDPLTKYDSFRRWINQEIGELTFPLSNDTTYWASAAMEAPNVMQRMQDGSEFIPSHPQELLLRITDYSPSFGSSTSETKVLLTGAFHDMIKDPSEQKWFCVFGDIQVPAELLQPGVLRCYSPPYPPGKVIFYVTCNGKYPCSEIRMFEYVADSKTSSDEGPVRASFNKRDILFQIRLARMLSQKSNSSNSDGITNLPFCSSTLSLFHELEQMEELLTETGDAMNVKEQLVQNLLKEKLELWLQNKILEGGKGAAVLDENGLGVLHMGAALGYGWIISSLLNAGVNINFRDSRGWTALHWAAHCGREALVAELLAKGADSAARTDPTNAFPIGQFAADVASSEGHKGIAGYLAESMLTTHLQSMHLHSMSNERKSTANGLDENVFERVVAQPDIIESEEQLSHAAVRKAAHAAALIHSEYRLQSFKKKQESYGLEEDEYGITNKEAQFIAAARKSNLSRAGHDADDALSNSAAVRIQQKFRGWKGRREFLLFRQNVVKIQAHFRGHQVRKQYKKILWSVSIVEKAILRWRRKGRGLRGFESSKLREGQDDHDDDFLKAGRRQIEKGLEKALERVQSMAKSPEAREQYRRLLESYERTKVHLQKDVGAFDGLDTSIYLENEMLNFSTDFASQM